MAHKFSKNAVLTVGLWHNPTLERFIFPFLHCKSTQLPFFFFIFLRSSEQKALISAPDVSAACRNLKGATGMDLSSDEKIWIPPSSLFPSGLVPTRRAVDHLGVSATVYLLRYCSNYNLLPLTCMQVFSNENFF